MDCQPLEVRYVCFAVPFKGQYSCNLCTSPKGRYIMVQFTKYNHDRAPLCVLVVTPLTVMVFTTCDYQKKQMRALSAFASLLASCKGALCVWKLLPFVNMRVRSFFMRCTATLASV